MPRSDETYLEAFIENISTLPHEIRRNLELMRDLDHSCSVLYHELQERQQEYIARSEAKVLELDVVEGGVKVVAQDGKTHIVIPTTEELIAHSQDIGAYQKIQSVHQDAMQKSEEKVAIAQQTFSLVDSAYSRLDSDIEKLEQYLKATGQFETPGMAKPNDLAAIQVAPGSPDWILAKVISFDPQSQLYKLADEDVESNKIFMLPESQVRILGGLTNLSRGDVVYAVYPDTTAFYQASIAQAPRRSGGGGNNSQQVVMVNFVDDSDENGITHDKPVLLQHVMLPP